MLYFNTNVGATLSLETEPLRLGEQFSVGHGRPC